MEPLWYQSRETLEPEQEISRKNSIVIDLISLLEWAKCVTFIYLFIFSYSYNPGKKIGQLFAESFLFWQLANLGNYTSEVQSVSA